MKTTKLVLFSAKLVIQVLFLYVCEKLNTLTYHQGLSAVSVGISPAFLLSDCLLTRTVCASMRVCIEAMHAVLLHYLAYAIWCTVIVNNLIAFKNLH